MLRVEKVKRVNSGQFVPGVRVKRVMPSLEGNPFDPPHNPKEAAAAHAQARRKTS